MTDTELGRPAGALVRDLVREVVADCAPEETVVVEGLLRYSDAQVVARLRRRRHGRDQLGFGIEDVVPLVAPVLWLTLEVARQRLAEAAVIRAERGLASLWRRVLRRGTEPEAIPPLTAEQRTMVERMVLDAAAEAELPADRARRIADRVAAALPAAESEGPRGDATELEGPDGSR
ncbi:hypothetical protein ABT026_28215 [Streptomyces sp. NPDC002734]|uniref:hypothetical protein n=1 Tax=Streptomyces sp. NPDC002734 TaxID=3154426 RepID=UPI00332ED016